jgi:hypothetical protein
MSQLDLGDGMGMDEAIKLLVALFEGQQDPDAFDRDRSARGSGEPPMNIRSRGMVWKLAGHLDPLSVTKRVVVMMI